MAEPGPVELAAGVDVHGITWSVSTGLGALFIDVGGLTAIIYCEGEPERFAEAVARAVTPGQANAEAECRECLGQGVIPVEGCTCGDGLPPYGHEPGCGWEPCPAGCPVPA